MGVYCAVLCCAYVFTLCTGRACTVPTVGLAVSLGVQGNNALTTRAPPKNIDTLCICWRGLVAAYILRARALGGT